MEKKAKDFFNENKGKVVTESDIETATGYKPSSIKTYFRKNWKNTILTRTDSGGLQITISKDLDDETYQKLQTQVHPQTQKK